MTKEEILKELDSFGTNSKFKTAFTYIISLLSSLDDVDSYQIKFYPKEHPFKHSEVVISESISLWLHYTNGTLINIYRSNYKGAELWYSVFNKYNQGIASHHCKNIGTITHAYRLVNNYPKSKRFLSYAHFMIGRFVNDYTKQINARIFYSIVGGIKRKREISKILRNRNR